MVQEYNPVTNVIYK